VKAVFDEELGDTTDIVVEREHKNCDIVIWRRADWVLVIENKIDWVQGKNQLHKYAQYWRRRFSKRYFVFLTRNGERPACKDFVGISYHVIRQVLTNLHGSEESEPFIRHFADHIWFA
jgi:type I site-specific restriction endonuclease